MSTGTVALIIAAIAAVRSLGPDIVNIINAIRKPENK